MYQAVRFEESIERYLEKIGATEPTEAARLLDELKGDGLSDETIYLLFALASARWIDHHGPYIGHGTLNMGPLIRAAELVDRSHKRLSLLQAAVYVLELLRNPNYGPYLQVQTDGVWHDTVEETQDAMLAHTTPGKFQYRTENLFIGLYRQIGQEVRWPLLRMGLLEYGHNEHKLLIVHRTLQLLDMGDHWNYGETLLRPAVQYLAAPPKYPQAWEIVETALEKYELSSPAILEQIKWESDVDNALASNLLQELFACEAGAEADLTARWLREGVNVPTIAEAIGLLSGLMLIRSHDNEEHIVTGIHCILELVANKQAPQELRLHALLVALQSDRTRSFKSVRGKMRELPFPLFGQEEQSTVSRQIQDAGNKAPDSQEAVSLSAIRSAIEEDETGHRAMSLVARYLRSQADTPARSSSVREQESLDALASELIAASLSNDGPFMAIHAAKMIWGQWLLTQNSTHPDRWLHFGSAASLLARNYQGGIKSAARVLQQWNKEMIR
ncbi:MAG TPA: hypothetical protein VFV52_14290 [Bacilli bacterium]|nr:hypothetical protein [Bacilli bacterium]